MTGSNKIWQDSFTGQKVSLSWRSYRVYGVYGNPETTSWPHNFARTHEIMPGRETRGTQQARNNRRRAADNGGGDHNAVPQKKTKKIKKWW
jgi:hypothetical protein